jgi:type IV pilus assembly protein PilM
MPAKKDLIVGLDMGSHSIKLVSLEKKRSRWTLYDFNVIPFPAGDEQDALRYEAWVNATLKETVNRMGLEGARVITTLEGSQVALRKLAFPVMPLEEIKEAARWQGKSAFPFPLEEALIAVHPLGKTKKEGESQQEVLVAAAQKGVVEQRLGLLKSCGLEPVCLTLAPLGLRWGYQYSASRIENESVALIDIGAETTTIAMVQHDELVFSREVPLGGMDFTRAVMDLSRDLNPAFPLKALEAERIKIRYGVKGDDFLFSEDETSEEGLPLRSLQGCMVPVLDRLVVEIDRSFGYFKTQVGEAAIDRIFLSGGGSLLKGLADTIKKNFNLPIAPYDFWDHLGLSPDLQPARLEEAKPFLTIAVGITVEERPPLNLIGFVKKAGFPLLGERARKAMAYGALPVAFFGFIAYQAASYHGELSKLKKRLVQRQQEVSRLEASKSNLDILKMKEAELEKKLADYPPSMIERIPVQAMISEIVRRMPDNATLTSLSLLPEPPGTAKKTAEGREDPGGQKQGSQAQPGPKGQGQLLLKGTVFGPGDVIIQSLDGFGKGLETVPYFSEVRLDEISKNETFGTIPAVNFQMNLHLRY